MPGGPEKIARWLCVTAVLICAGAAGSGEKAPARKPPPQEKTAAADVARKLRAQWKLGDLNLTREAIEEASFAPDIKKAAIAAVDWFVARQEALLKDVEREPAREAEARASRAELEAKYRQRMAMIYDDPEMMAELSRRLKALNRELETLADSADRMFEKLEAAGLTPEQREKLKPVVRQASEEIKRTVAKSASGSPNDDQVRDEAVAKYREARKKVQQHLTPAQRARLARKMAED